MRMSEAECQVQLFDANTAFCSSRGKFNFYDYHAIYVSSLRVNDERT